MDVQQPLMDSNLSRETRKSWPWTPNHPQAGNSIFRWHQGLKESITWASTIQVWMTDHVESQCQETPTTRSWWCTTFRSSPNYLILTLRCLELFFTPRWNEVLISGSICWSSSRAKMIKFLADLHIIACIFARQYPSRRSDLTGRSSLFVHQSLSRNFACSFCHLSSIHCSMHCLKKCSHSFRR